MNFEGSNKIGGASLDSPNSIYTFTNHVQNNIQCPAIIVVSGFKNSTNILAEMISALCIEKIGEAKIKKEELMKLHFSIVYNLFSQEHKIFDEILSIINKIDLEKNLKEDYELLCGKFLGLGEELSSLIISEYLQIQGVDNDLVDARKYILTDGISNSSIDWSGTRERISCFAKNAKKSIQIFPGFIGTDAKTGKASVMKRENSDATNIALAGALGINLRYWKKRGVYNNPKKIHFYEFVKKSENTGLLANDALYLIERYKKDFWIINFDDISQKTFVHF